MSLVISVVMYALLGIIINLLLGGTTSIASAVLTGLDSVFAPQNSSNILSGIIDLIPFNIDFLTFIVFLVKGMLLIMLAIGVLRSILSPITGENVESPWQVLFNTIIAYFLICLLFGTDFLSSSFTETAEGYRYGKYFAGGLLADFGRIFSDFMSSAFELAKSSTLSFTPDASARWENTTQYLGTIILAAGIMGSVISGAIAIIERAVQLAIFIILGPVSVAFYSNSSTRKTASTWFMGVLSQYFALGISLMFWGIAMKSLEPFYANIRDSFDKGIAFGALSIVFFSICGNSEELFNAIGFKTMSPMDAAKMVGTGVSDMLRASNTFGSIGQNAYRSVRGTYGALKNDGSFFNQTKNGIASKLYNPRSPKNGIMASAVHKALDAARDAETLKSGEKVVPKLNGLGKEEFGRLASSFKDVASLGGSSVSTAKEGYHDKAIDGLKAAKALEACNPNFNDAGSSECEQRAKKYDGVLSDKIPYGAVDTVARNQKTGQYEHVAGVLGGINHSAEKSDVDMGFAKNIGDRIATTPCIKLPEGYDAGDIKEISGIPTSGTMTSDLSSVEADGRKYSNSIGLFQSTGVARTVFSQVQDVSYEADKPMLNISSKLSNGVAMFDTPKGANITHGPVDKEASTSKK